MGSVQTPALRADRLRLHIAEPGESSEKPASPRRFWAAQRFALRRMRSAFEGCRGKARPGVAVLARRNLHELHWAWRRRGADLDMLREAARRHRLVARGVSGLTGLRS